MIVGLFVTMPQLTTTTRHRSKFIILSLQAPYSSFGCSAQETFCIPQVEAECQELKAENDLASQEVEALWAEKQAREAQIQQLEVELEQERHMADSLVGAMKPELRDRFMQLKSANVEYARAMEEMNQELDVLASRKAVLEDEMAVSAVKREAVGLYEQLAAAEARKEELQAEARERGTPQQERERLLAQVKKRGHKNSRIFRNDV